MLFYATVPFVLFAGKRVIQSSPFVAIGLFGTLWAFDIRSGIAPHYLAYCYLGLQFGAWQRKVITSGVLLSSVATVTAAAIILPIISPFPDIVSPLLGLAPPVCALLLYAAIRVPFRVKPIEFFGHVSYSLYLLHIIVLSKIGTILISDGYSRWTVAAACIALATISSAITLRLIERPATAAGIQIIRFFSPDELAGRPTRLPDLRSTTKTP
jgi:peptidoglycan/LPS O-acetylase OafA/YrhL